MLDLFGNECDAPQAKAPAAVALNLFDAAAERLAYVTGRALSQEKTELMNGCSEENVRIVFGMLDNTLTNTL